MKILVINGPNLKQISYVRLACVKIITGHGTDGYLEAIEYLIEDR